MSARAQGRGSVTDGKREPARFTSAQVWRQVGLILLVVVLWAGLLTVTLRLTSTGATGVAESTPAAAATATVAQAPAPTEKPAEPATDTPQPAVPATEQAAEPSPTAAEPPAATEPPPPPTEMPTAVQPTEEPTAGAPPAVSFAADVLPVLQSRCERCHSGGRVEAGLELTSYAGVMAGSDKGPVVVPGSSVDSELVKVIVSGEMPRRAPKLPAAEIEVISAWVDAGALDN